MPHFVRNHSGLCFVLSLLLLLLVLPQAVTALPVAVEQVESRHSLRPSAFYLVDKGGAVSILEASSPLRQNQYMRLEDGIPVTAEGLLWLRFSLIKNNQALMRPLPEGSRPPLYLDLGSGMSGARLYVAESVSTNGEIKAWRESLPLGNGRFELPDPELLPLTVYVKLPGIPSLWFDPVLLRGSEDSGPFTWTLILQISMGLALAIMLVRGITENEEWRFWAAAVLACAMVPALFGQYGSEPRIIYLTAMPRLLAPGLAVMLLPHLGRYLLRSRGKKALDYTLIILSIPGMAAALAPLVPSLGWTARLLPLAPLLTLPLILIAAFKAKNGQSGAALYLFFCLFPFAGALAALIPLLSPAFPALELLGPNLTPLGYLAGGLLMAVGKPAESKEKGDFFPLNDLFDDGPLAESGRNNSVTIIEKAEPLANADYPDELMDGPPLELEPAPAEGYAASAATSEESEAPDEPQPDEAAASPAYADPEPLLIDLGLDMDIFADEEAPAQDEPPAEAGEAPNELPGEAAADGAALEAPQEYVAEATLHMKKDENIIYIKDEEEPGLVILKQAGPAPIAGLAPVHPAPAHNWEYTALNRLGNALRAPYEELVSQLAELKSRQEFTADYVDGLDKSLSGLGLMLDNLERLARGEELSDAPSQTVFNLSQMIRRIHEELLPLAEERGITLSWFVAPGLPAHFMGLEQEISQAVKFLMQGTLDGASSGAVQLSVRQGIGPYAGQIQFSLQENGLHSGHMQRPSGWLNKAWELAAASGGSFNIDFIPGKGMAITLALPLTPVNEPPAAPEAPAAQDNPLDMPGSAALAEFAPGPEPEGAEDPLPGLPSIEEEDDDEVILLTDAIIPQKTQPEAAAAPEPEPPVAEEVEPQPEPEPEAQPEPEPELEPEPEAAPADEPEPQSGLIVLADDELADVPAALSGDVSAPRPVKEAPAQPKAEPAPVGPREYIVIADMAASGRRLIARRLEGLPHKLLEARNADEIVKAVSHSPVGLIIIDADMPEQDVKGALEKVAEYNAKHALPATPSLGLLSHESQGERLLRLGCSETQVKSTSRVQFRQAVLRLAPHPKADPAELLPESPLLRSALAPKAQAENVEALEAVAPAPAPPAAPAPKSKDKKTGRVPMLDLIVATLDESASGPVEAQNGGGKSLKAPYPLSSSDGESMEAEMVPLIPGLLIVLEESLDDLAGARARADAEHVKDIASRMAGQGSTFGLSTLERMARCLEKAADAGDAEAIRDFSDELVGLGRRYLASLKETHEDYLKKH